MTSAHIKINGTGSRHNRQLREFVDRLQEIINDAARLKAVFDQAALGEDWAALAVLLDMESGAEAETLYNLFGSANGELQGATFIPQLLSRAG